MITKLYHYLLICCILLQVNIAFGQSYSGVAHDKTTISEVYSNPALALTDDAFQVNVAGLSFLADNNAYGVVKSDAVNGTTPQGGKNYFKLPGDFKRAAWVNLDVLGPSVAFKVKKKYTFAITTRARFMLNLDNLSNNIFQLIDNKVSDTSFVYRIDNLSLTTQLFTEINFIYSGYIYQSEDFSLTGGVGFKVLTGVAAAEIGFPQGQFQLHEDNTPFNLKGSAVNVAFTPYANTWLSSGQPFNSFDKTVANTGYGLDVGAVYYATPQSGVHVNHDGYVFRLAASLTDIGSINYTASSTTGSYVSKSDTFNYNNINRDASRTYGQTIYDYLKDSVIAQTASRSSFKMGLPTALRLNADAKVGNSGKFNSYLNVSLLLNLRKPSADNFSTHYVSTCVIAPRFLWRNYGVGIPFSFNANKQGFLGLTFYAGPFYIGTSSLANFLILKNINAADAYLGIAFRIPGKKQDLY